MRVAIILGLASLLLLSGCAYEGTVVRKEFRPVPFSESLGLDGFYYFELRDREGHLHDQMVTPEVFSEYEVGHYFNDLAQPRALEPTAPEPVPMSPHRPLEGYQTHYRTVEPVDAPPNPR